MDNTPEIERLEPTQQGVSEGTKARKTRKVKKKRAAPKKAAKNTGSSTSGSLLANLKIWQKLALIAASLTLPLVIFVFFYAASLQQNVSTALQKDQGALFLREAGDLVQLVPQHRGITNAFRNGNESVAERRDNLQAQVNANLAEVLAFETQVDDNLQLSSQLADLEAGWRNIEENLFTLPSGEVFNMHTAWLQNELFLTLAAAGNTSTLKFDNRQEIVYLSELVTRDLPNLTETLGRMRGYGAGVLASGQMTQQNATVLTAMVGEVNDYLRSVNLASSYIFDADPELSGSLALSDALPLGPTALSLTNEALLNAENPDALTYGSTLYFDQMTEIIDAFITSYNASLDVLVKRLDARVAEARRSLFLTLGALALGLALIALLVVYIARQITRPVDELATVAERVGKGDFSRFAKVGTKDELGTLAGSFNLAITELRQIEERNELERQQSAQLQANVGAFLDVAMDIAEGDFTKRGNVSEDVLGNIVDAINVMVEEVAYLLGQTRDAALSVNEGASEMIATTESIAQSAQRQAAEAERARAETEQVTDSIRKMAQQADESANASTQALEASRQGETAVQNTLKGMEGIRNEVQSITERTKSLTQRSDEISGIVRSISRIASQTNLLALSASLEAAGAGEAGKRFATVATEVQELAEDSANAARQVASIIRELQSEINEVAELTESGSKEVETGYKVATEAGQRLREIADISTKSAELARFISRATQEQVQGVEGVNEIVQTMTEISQASQGSVTQGRDAAEKLQQLAAQLSESLSRFRLNA